MSLDFLKNCGSQWWIKRAQSERKFETEKKSYEVVAEEGNKKKN